MPAKVRDNGPDTLVSNRQFRPQCTVLQIGSNFAERLADNFGMNDHDRQESLGVAAYFCRAAAFMSFEDPERASELIESAEGVLLLRRRASGLDSHSQDALNLS